MAFTYSPKLIHWRKSRIHPDLVTKVIRHVKTSAVQGKHPAPSYSTITLSSSRPPPRRPWPRVDRSAGTRRTSSIPFPAHPTSLTSNYPPILKLLPYLGRTRTPMRRCFKSQPGLVLPLHSYNVWDDPHALSGKKSQAS